LIYDANGALLYQSQAYSSDHLVTDATLAPGPFDPQLGPLAINSGDWKASYSGRDSQGNFVPNGTYEMEIKSDSGPKHAELKVIFTVLNDSGPGISLVIGHNPVMPGANFVVINWVPAQPVELSVYDSAGELIRDFAPGPMPPATWDLKTSSGKPAGEGIYVVVARIPGQRARTPFKLALVR
jgi:hypothetical protein